ncbi:MAG: [FeFe] hydrogenase H-cluster maturation GTPase HydF [Endomicrobia bacterium]|nr:[FeFe] hydrogenase H-cluster maturation GTPase HydF [Endomicrobiia bacterium]
MKALTVQIGIFGRTNVGKSSLMNFITGQNTSIVAEIAGTTTDLVYKQMELNPLGPVTLIDTAGIDDKSVLGEARFEKTQKAFDASDIAVLICEAGIFGEFEKDIAAEAEKRKTPLIIVVGKTDLKAPEESFVNQLKSYTKHILNFTVKDSRDAFLNGLKSVLLETLPENYIENYSPLKNIIKQDDIVVLVVPIDLGAPRGRLIMSQIQTIRNILDLNAAAHIAKNDGYAAAVQKLKIPPALVITDSQVVKEVVSKTAENVKVTTFSTLFSAEKSDIIEMAKGAAKLKSLKKGDRVLIAEACTHHASSDDIGRVKIPKWLKEYAGQDIEFDVSSGQDYPKDLNKYKVIIHCGACTLNRKAMLSRLNKAVEAGVAITNYGIAISVFQGVIEKVLEIFPEALAAYQTAMHRRVDAE